MSVKFVVITLAFAQVIFAATGDERFYAQDDRGQLYLSRFRRQANSLGNRNYMQAAAQPSVVVVPNNGVPTTVYRGSSYGVQGMSYGTQGAYGMNRSPTVVVSMPDPSGCKKSKKKKKKLQN